MGGLFSGLGKMLFGDPTKGIKKGADENLAFQQQGLDYLKETQAPVLERREAAAEPLMGFYTDPAQQAQFYEDAQQSPAFDYMRDAGEESLLRTSAATGFGGGMRGGGTREAMAGIAPNIMQNLVNQRLQGLQGFAGQDVNAGQVAQQYGSMGQNRLNRALGVGQAEQDLAGQTLNLGFKAFGAF